MAKEYDVVGVGITAFDIVIEVDRYPGPDEKAQVPDIRYQGGGLTGTAMVTVARLGGSSAFHGAVGDDLFSEFCLREFEQDGVDVSSTRRKVGRSVVVALIVTDVSAGTRMIIATSGRAARMTPEDVDEEMIRRAGVVHVDDHHPEAALAAARAARRLGVATTMDLELANELTGEFIAVGDYTAVPLGLAAQRYGTEDPAEGARALLAEMAPSGGKAAIVTAGARGSFGLWADGAWRQPAYRVDVVDTTGCGDVYHGALALGVARGWDLERSMRFASATAALKCRKPGGRMGIPTADEVAEFLRTAEPLPV
jgi:sulfofructose kinase